MSITIPIRGNPRRPMIRPPKPQYALMAAAQMQSEGRFEQPDQTPQSSAALASTQQQGMIQ